ncbi:hypothetical protein BT93_L2661 [Corymbia citriodora subsp. variegata]|uniref:Uncharacterized protein n=1 Tax=Corymbia citriodora subsp. variegata TaxID=360336 RepID=A0A8T0CKI1_CORYI|nr:hypothetical protein BT93_L2661 [Corymbia citriodora subsp. variegata]
MVSPRICFGIHFINFTQTVPFLIFSFSISFERGIVAAESERGTVVGGAGGRRLESGSLSRTELAGILPLRNDM